MTNEAGFKLLELEYSRVPKYLRDINTICLFFHSSYSSWILLEYAGDRIKGLNKVSELLKLYTWNPKLRDNDYPLWEVIVSGGSYEDYLEE